MATMKELAVDESLSEETRESAQQALDELVMAQIEQERTDGKAAAARRKLVAEYTPLQEDLEELGVEAVEDLKELEAEQVEQLAAKLKFVEAKKFAKKMAALQAE